MILRSSAKKKLSDLKVGRRGLPLAYYQNMEIPINGAKHLKSYRLCLLESHARISYSHILQNQSLRADLEMRFSPEITLVLSAIYILSLITLLQRSYHLKNLRNIYFSHTSNGGNRNSYQFPLLHLAILHEQFHHYSDSAWVTNKEIGRILILGNP